MRTRNFIALIIVISAIVLVTLASVEFSYFFTKPGGSSNTTATHFTISSSGYNYGNCVPTAYADCSRADLASANLEGVNLTGANLMGANLNHADLQYADLENATFVNANLQDTMLQNANLLGANLTGSNYQNGFLCNTVMPDGSIDNSDCS